MSTSTIAQNDACDPIKDVGRVGAWRVGTALACITLLGATLRLIGLARYSLWYDEGSTMYAVELAAAPLRLLNPDWLTEPPLVPMLTYAWLHLLAAIGVDFTPGEYHTDFLVRLLPCAFSIAAVPIAFSVARRLTGSAATSLIVSGLIAIAPFHIFYAQELRPYATMTALMLGALWCLSVALEADRARHWAFFTILLALAMYNHFFTVWYIASLGLAVCLISVKRRRVSPGWVVSQLALFVLILPAVKQGLVINEVISNIESSWYPPLTATTGLITIKTFFAGYSPRAWAYYPMFGMGLVLAACGIWSLRHRGESMIVLLAVGALPILGNLIVWSLRTFSYYEHRLFIVCAALFAVLVSAGFAELRSRALRFIIAGAWIGLTVPCLNDYYAQRIHPSEQHRLGVRYKVANRYVSNAVRADLRDGDVVGHFSHVTYFPMKSYYLSQAKNITLGFTGDDRLGMLASYPHESVWDHAGALPVRVDRVTAQYDRMWYVESWWEPFSPPQSQTIARAWLDRHARFVTELDRFGIRLRLYDFAATRETYTRIEWVADAGESSLPRYIDESGAKFLPAIKDALGPTRTWRLEQADVPGKIIVRNDGPGERTLVWRVYGCAEAIEPLSFQREKPDDVWRPIVHADPAFVDSMDPIKIGAALARDKHESGSIFANIRLEKGSYRVGAYIWRETGAGNTSRARIEVCVENPHEGSGDSVTTDVVPWAAEGESGWAWFELERFDADGGPVRLTITANVPPELDHAFADVGRVVFVPIVGRDEIRPFDPLVSNGPFTLASGQQEEFDIRKFFRPAGRFDIFVEDKADRTTRYVNWYGGG